MTTHGDLDWRHPTPEDAPAWAEMMRAVEAVDHTDIHMSEGDLADEFANPRRDPANAWFGWDSDGGLGAFGWTHGIVGAVDLHRVQVWGAVRPDLRRSGIGSYLLVWLEDRGRAIHAELHPGKEGVLEVHAAGGNPGHVAMLRNAGYEPLRYWFEMRRPVDHHPLPIVTPDGLELRPYSDDLSEAVRVAHNDAFLDHWGSSARSVEDWEHTDTGHYFVPGASFVMLDGDEVAGYLMSQHYAADAEMKGFREGWINTVGTRRAWRGRGIASAMIAAAIAAYREAGYQYACLGVDAANPTGALALYERLGFTTFQSEVSFAKPI